MSITITIQTHNRADELRRTLLSLARVDLLDTLQHEILVIDNNSSDHTSTVVSEVAPSFSGHLRYVWEPRQGLSHARNRAIAEAVHDVIAFLDDDVDIDVNWLRNLA